MPYGVVFSGFDVPRHPLITQHPILLGARFPLLLVYKTVETFSDVASFSPQFTHHAHTLELTTRNNGGGDMFKQGGVFGCYILTPEKLA